ncbi:peptidoglycan DD-metalloendopeptidase family protein [Legionella israelensis]|uniref:LysM domain-containing protein n=1 Tax=Legionella israelensis TaxID=454 RepID=A0A0W0VI29_9GAMM|nr:peptidoglycan DD-metalloendopeptidase family protein [Legionella israelensis]KTD19517.1 hypothetical protein Lisr_2079 [Legionella israelensis]SCY38278.1 lipoprotein NlpD [Legionella israelensis DSM 19235]STX58335.1 lipoprotein NlpD [Legionella israelensis]
MMLIKSRTWLSLFLLPLLGACSERDVPAPIEELKWQPYSIHEKTYTVKKGDTLYAIAFKYDKDYHDLADVNQLKHPYSLYVGQKLKLQFSAASKYPKKLKKPEKKKKSIFRSKSKVLASSHSRTSFWMWPVRGQIAASFIPQQGKKGINIAGKAGDKIRASADGIVAYAGNGLSGYGNLIIVKHNGEFLTAYGNNAKNLVREGQHVKSGQIIADMGIIDRRYRGLHFEIRKRGKPVNPLNFLEKKG